MLRWIEAMEPSPTVYRNKRAHALERGLNIGALAKRSGVPAKSTGITRRSA
jgi:hypothetical protein